MKRIVVFAYGLISYAISLLTFVYLAAFLANLLPIGSMDSPPVVPLWQALIINTLLVAVFGVQHSVMARPAFKQWWTQFVPQPMERSTYLLFSDLALILLIWQWRPMGGVIWDVQAPIGRGILYGLYAVGWLIVLGTTFLLNHFDLFGLRQVWLYLRGKPYTSLAFRTPGPYRIIRHPLYVGWLTVFWATPTMTIAHLVFPAGMTVYILIAIWFEERNLMTHFGEAYVDYRRTVPMLIPLPRGDAGKAMTPEPTPAPASGNAS